METIGQNEEGARPDQNRSSSLSDIEDRADEHMGQSPQSLPAIESDQNDTEAETERLEDSPQKSRKNQEVNTIAADSVHNAGGSSIEQRANEPQAGDGLRNGLDTAFLSDSSMDDSRIVPVHSPSRKRKRSDVEYRDLGSQRSSREPRFGDSKSVKNFDKAPMLGIETQPNNLDGSPDVSDGEGRETEEEIRGDQIPLPMKGKRGDWRKRKTSNYEIRMNSPSNKTTNGIPEPTANNGPLDSNGDDAEMDDGGEQKGIENTIRDEENSELYDERLARCDAELSMLAGPTITHPELLGMKEVLEQRRDERIQYESKLMKYKLGSLENKSKAEKAQIHGQYIQTIGDIRDRKLEQANKEWYQIHKERRSRDDDVPEYMYHYPLQRSQQITNQTAYNKEVSLLSGIAKYRGFPAAPEIRGAKPDEIDSDLERMGIGQQLPAQLARHPPALRSSLSANAVLSRPQAVTDEHFLEQNPWANPQHPAHLHRQASAISRTVSPLVAPASQKRPAELIGRHKAASAAQPLRSSMGMKSGPVAEADVNTGLDTPTRILPPSSGSSNIRPESIIARPERPRTTLLTALEKANSSGTSRNQAQEMHVKPYIPKMPRKTDSQSSALVSRLPTSPSTRFPTLQAEDFTRLPDQSSIAQQHNHPASLSANMNGAGDRYGPS
ncbi:MAG: hypothetical protein Q9219_002578 [cf. Caloplaca sp. 3 TL-2023]